MTRLEKLNKYLKHWQRVLNLQQWDLKIKLVNFNRKDYIQSGDIKVDLKKKFATILITKERNNKDNFTILHELIHLILWEYDHFCEKNISKQKKDKYFNLLEQTVADLTDIIFQRDK